MTLFPFDQLLIATRNPAKEKRYRKILAPYAARLIGLDNVKISGKPEELGETAEENAQIKARFYAAQAGCAAFSEDEALFVDFLPRDKQPGVHVRRINGKEDASDDQVLAYWETLIAGRSMGDRTGCWHIAYCFALPGGAVTTFALDFPVQFFSPSSPIRIPGWPMSSLEGPLEIGLPHSELTEAELAQMNRTIDLSLQKVVEVLFKGTDNA